MKYSFLTIIAMAGVVLTGTTAHAAKAYNKDYFGETIQHKAAFEDTLIHLARNNGLGFVELRAANPTLDPWIPGAGKNITLPKKHILPDGDRKGLLINLAEMRVYYFKTPGESPQTYPISIGREGLQTPTGRTKIVRKADGPTWRPTARMKKEDPELPDVVPPGPDNPLGTHALYFGWPQYMMHGTNKPYGIGRRVSSGCMRMYPEDIKALFPQVPVGTPVHVVDQPVKVGWVGDKLYIEVSPTQDQSLKIEEDGIVGSYEVTTDDMKRITKKAGAHADKIDWAAVRRAVQEHSGVPVRVLDINRNVSQSKNARVKQKIIQETVSKEDVSASQVEETLENLEEVAEMESETSDSKMKLNNVRMKASYNN